MNNDVKIYTSENIHEISIDKPPLQDGQIYIYVLLNAPQGNIKIGKTTNIQQRYKSLSGSNSGGNKIIACYCSPATYITSMENTCHNHYEWCRVSGTEWFDGNKISFNEVVEYIDELFKRPSYEKCNNLRKKLLMQKLNRNI